MTAETSQNQIHTRLATLAGEIAAKTALHAHPFLRALAGLKPPVAVADIYGYCTNPDTSPYALLWDIADAMKNADLTKAPTTPPEIWDLAALMCLTAGERCIQQSMNGQQCWVNGVPNIAMTEELTAALVAASWLNLTLQLRCDGTGKIEVANLISDLAEQQFGVKGLAQTIDDEINKRVNRFREIPIDESKKFHPKDIKHGIDKMEQKTGARLVVGLRPTAIPYGVSDTLRQDIRRRWDVEIFLYGNTTSADTMEQWEETQNSLIEHFKTILTPLYRSAERETAAESSHDIQTTSPPAPQEKFFDVFLSHNSQDKPVVRELTQKLETRGLRVWLDEEQLIPGRPWQAALETAIKEAKTAAVLIGANGLGPWETPEMHAFLQQTVSQKLPVIPVLLPGAPTAQELPLLLQSFTWVDLRDGMTEPALNKLEWGITGVKPVIKARQLG
ncbi:MAG: toll/interleukin-1 receptor domain-containing protein [Methylococcaceae bacterium]|nr:MAG: toll/interleukin-1 receptor domain-containing protein [Methylococcaceae bacterium]